MNHTTCSSCGLTAPARALLPESPFPASPECWATYGQLAAYDAQRARLDFRHQEAVDAYAGQHPGPPGKPITLWFALVGLHLAIDLGKTGREVQRAHSLLARRPRDWPTLVAPPLAGPVTVAEVMAQPGGDQRDAAILHWAEAVWACWREQHGSISKVAATIYGQ